MRLVPDCRCDGKSVVERILTEDHGKASYQAALAWDKIPWDPDSLTKLAVDAGAKYIVFARTSFILNHPSRFNDVPGSPFMRMQPVDRDYVREMSQSTRAHGMRFGLYTNYMVPTLIPEWIEIVK